MEPGNSGLCQYSNALGEPGKSVHSIRLFGVSVVDVVLTVLLAYFVSKMFKTSFVFALVLCFVWGIVLHRAFCVKTKIN
jgi:hypothetical protein